MRKADAEGKLNKRNRKVGEFLDAVSDGRGAEGVPGGVVTRVTIRMPTRSQPEALLVIKVTGDGGDMVGFVGGLDLCQAVLIWAAKDSGGGLRWREDIPWEDRG